MSGLWRHQTSNIKYVHTLCQAITFIVVFHTYPKGYLQEFYYSIIYNSPKKEKLKPKCP